MEIVSVEVLSLLVLVALVAGMIDAIAGGGGLLALPALLFTGLPPTAALATNKLQGSFGTLTAMLNFRHKGQFRFRKMILPITLTFAGSVTGTELVKQLGNEALSGLLPLLLMGFSLYFLFSPRIRDEDAQPRMSVLGFAFSAGFAIGFYDGFFGPGTGSFFAMAFVSLLGFNLRKATAQAKVLNFTSNIASLLFFASNGLVVWSIGLSMGLGQIVGGYLGSHLALRHGTKLIRPMLVLVTIAISIKLLVEFYSET